MTDRRPRKSRRRTLQGYTYRDQPLGAVPSGIVIQAPGTFGFDLVDLDKSANAAEYAAVVDDVGIPWTAQLYICWLDPLEVRPAYRVDIVGTGAEPPDPPTAPEWWDYFLFTHPFLVRPWRYRITVRATGEWMERRWHPAGDLHTYIHRHATTRLLAEAREADKALYEGEAVFTVRGGGRPRGTGIYPDRDAFLADLLPIVQQLQANAAPSARTARPPHSISRSITEQQHPPSGAARIKIHRHYPPDNSTHSHPDRQRIIANQSG
jgi:hypothetical protein